MRAIAGEDDRMDWMLLALMESQSYNISITGFACAPTDFTCTTHPYM